MPHEPPAATIRPARPGDETVLVEMIRELARYENLEHQARATPENLARDLFGPHPHAESILAVVEGDAVGFALYFPSYSTFRAQPGLYLEDLFVRPAFRGRGIGKALLARLAALAVARGYGRLEWSVLDWNAPSIAFYRSLSARPMDEWTVYRLEGDAVRSLADSAHARPSDPADGVS